eukprot:3457757-Rhodomonas_salina.5
MHASQGTASPCSGPRSTRCVCTGHRVPGAEDESELLWGGGVPVLALAVMGRGGGAGAGPGVGASPISVPNIP